MVNETEMDSKQMIMHMHTVRFELCVAHKINVFGINESAGR